MMTKLTIMEQGVSLLVDMKSEANHALFGAAFSLVKSAVLMRPDPNLVSSFTTALSATAKLAKQGHVAPVRCVGVLCDAEQEFCAWRTLIIRWMNCRYTRPSGR